MDQVKLYMPYLLSAISIYMTVMAGNKHPKAWLLGLFNQVLWLVWIVASESWGFVPLNLTLWAVYARNHLKWNTPQKEDLDFGSSAPVERANRQRQEEVRPAPESVPFGLRPLPATYVEQGLERAKDSKVFGRDFMSLTREEAIAAAANAAWSEKQQAFRSARMKSLIRIT